MHVKQIIIQGFKSYKDQTVVEPFSSKLNVIVGRNGSGKSNFFAAIRFVLSDAYTQMGREERQALLHEGSGSAVMSAYVEIVFDNSDERFPTGRPELVLRRTIGLKKDEYSLDRKNATRTDVMNLLESAGFSRSNPYYIVPQGRVTALTNMKDGERLNLLKEVAGTQVYEARRTESLKIMNDTDNKRSKIDDLLAYIRERLGELEEEKEELRAYQDKDKERRCLEYTIYSREQQEVNNALEAIDELRQTGVDETDENRQQFNQAEQEIGKLETQANEIRQQVNLLKVDKTQLEDERRETARNKAKAELNVKSISDGQPASEAARLQHSKELRAVKDAIKQKEKELAQILPRYNENKKKEETIKAQLDEVEGARQRLYAKQGRTSQFANQKQRDQWLQKELQEINVAIAKRKAVRLEAVEEITELEKSIQALESNIADLRSQIDSRGDTTNTLSDELLTVKEQREKLMDQRKELWREEARLDSVIQNAQQEFDRAERFLNHMMDQNTARGLAAVRRIQKQHKLHGLYGTLAELFEVPDRYKTAVEVTAGASLFHYVVDTDATATKVMEILQKEKAGRVTFMPLNRLKSRPVNIPKASDAVHMLSKLKYDPKYEPAFEHVFGKTIICPNLQVAAQYARSHSVSAITPEGDRADKKGALTGGFHDPRQSRLDAMRIAARKRDELSAYKDRAREIQTELERMDQEVSRSVGEVQKVEQRKQRLESSFGQVAQELRSSTLNLQSRKDALESKRRAKENVEAAARDLGEQQEAYEQELATPYTKNLTADEEKQLHSLTKRAQAFQVQYNEFSKSRSEFEGQKTLLEVELKENLRLRLDQLDAQGIEIGTGKVDYRLKECMKELDRLDASLRGVESKLQATEEAIDKANSALSETVQNISELQKRQEELTRAIERYQKRIEKSMARKAILMDKAAECSRNVRDLGVLPKEAFEKYQKMQSDKAIKRLHKVNEALKSYSHVNKKAFEQYANFTKQRDTLSQRRSELDSSHKSIEDLIGVLDQRKDEAIERTFKQVSKEFANVFEKLVPAGKGRLIIQRKSDRAEQNNEEEEDSDQERRESVENYIGVGISVSFNSKHDDQQRIQQLSGGQKSLCALALVFAIQQCDPAPFYLFDEIDANLDAQYRTAVAQMLKNISEKGEGGQFICTTFRPEVVHVAEKCYGVAYSNKTSSIDVVNKEQALEFVEGQKQ